MGISDLAQDLEDQRDRVLLIGPEPVERARIRDVLHRRNYDVTELSSIVELRDVGIGKTFDLAIIEALTLPGSPEELFDDLRLKAGLRGVPLVVVHPLGIDPGREIPNGLTVLPAPVDPTSLVVKVATALRLRKLGSAESSFTAKVAAQNTQLRDLTNRFRRELREAQEIQLSILPKELPRSHRCELSSRYHPLEGVGGDFYDVWWVDDNTVGLFAGDVTGHGLPAALIGSMTKMALSYADKSSPAALLASVNAGLTPHMPSGRFLTAISAFYDVTSGALAVARGGHPPGFLWRAASQKVEVVKPRGMPLGFSDGLSFEQFDTRLECGDRFFMVTDGLTETASMDGKQLGVEGTGELVARASQCATTVDEAVDAILRLREDYSGGRLLKDDVTLLGLACCSVGSR